MAGAGVRDQRPTAAIRGKHVLDGFDQVRPMTWLPLTADPDDPDPLRIAETVALDAAPVSDD